jgi:hypothetical protein
MRAMLLQQFTELLDGKASISGNTAHGECIDRIVARNRHDTLTIAHDDMLALGTIRNPVFSSARTASR